METERCRSQLYDACHVLFGAEINVSDEFLRYLQMPGLKAMYRKKALETHPDRAVALACRAVDLEAQFKEINAAYQELHDYLENPRRFTLIDGHFRKGAGASQRSSSRMRPQSKTHSKPKDKPREGCRSRFFTGVVPKRVLLFGQYAYYSGVISYRQLIDAIIWQKIQRPLLGNIAVRWGWLDEDEVREILRLRRWGEKFGEASLRGGYLTPDKLRIVLGRQRMLQPRLGKYFVEERILAASLVEKMAGELRRHNRLYKSR